ncbi:MAG: hypothetical protein ACRECQ_19420, partial [Burkholderiaceae bacterium]
NTLLARKQFLERSLGGKPAPDAAMNDSMSDKMMADESPMNVARRRLQRLEQTASVRIDSAAWLQRVGMAPERVAAPAARSTLERAVLVMPATSTLRDGSLGLDVLRALVLDPAYQLK